MVKKVKNNLKLNVNVLVSILLIFISGLTVYYLFLLKGVTTSKNIKPYPSVYVTTIPAFSFAEKSKKIIVDYPKENSVVTSPLVIKGKAKGTWFFEGEFPITLYYGVKNDFVTANAKAIGEWMTEDYVDFEATINFEVPKTNDGLLVLQKNNPSDLEENNEEISLKVKFH